MTLVCVQRTTPRGVTVRGLRRRRRRRTLRFRHPVPLYLKKAVVEPCTMLLYKNVGLAVSRDLLFPLSVSVIFRYTVKDYVSAPFLKPLLPCLIIVLMGVGWRHGGHPWHVHCSVVRRPVEGSISNFPVRHVRCLSARYADPTFFNAWHHRSSLNQAEIQWFNQSHIDSYGYRLGAHIRSTHLYSLRLVPF